MSIAFQWDCEGTPKSQVSDLQQPLFLVNEKVLGLKVSATVIAHTGYKSPVKS